MKRIVCKRGRFDKIEIDAGVTFQKYRKKPISIKAARIDEPFEVETLEGTMCGNAGDWLICGVMGEYYPCKPDVFALTYEKVEEE